MKKHLLNGILLATFIAAAPAAMAGGKKDKSSKVEKKESTSGIHVKFLGEEKDFVFIEISLNQDSVKTGTLKINDATGETLYNERVFTEQFSRIFKLSPGELNRFEVVFASGKSIVRKRYDLNVITVKTTELKEVTQR